MSKTIKYTAAPVHTIYGWTWGYAGADHPEPTPMDSVTVNLPWCGLAPRETYDVPVALHDGLVAGRLDVHPGAGGSLMFTDARDGRAAGKVKPVQ